MIRACIKLEGGIHSLRNLFWLVKDTFLSEIVSNNTINPTWRVFEKVHDQHSRIYHSGSSKINVWFESYFYPRKPSYLLNLKKSQFYFLRTEKNCENQEKKTDRQLVMSRNSPRIKASRKAQGMLLLSCKSPDFFSGLSQLYRIIFKNDGVYVGWRVFLSILFVYMLHRRPPLHGREQWLMRSKRSHR